MSVITFHMNHAAGRLELAIAEADPATRLELLRESQLQLKRALEEAWEDVKAIDPKAQERAHNELMAEHGRAMNRISQLQQGQRPC